MKNILKFLKTFCADCTIHGFRYFTERRHWSERLWWIVAVVLSAILCGSSIYDIWMNWNENPVLLSLGVNDLPISSIPFPTVTVCPQIKIQKQKFDITSVYLAWKQKSRQLTDEEQKIWETVNHVCAYDVAGFVAKRQQFMDDSIYDAIRYMAPAFNDIFIACLWQRDSMACAQGFSPVWTDDGLCYAFNAFNSHEMYTDKVTPQLMTVKSNPNISHWSLDSGYDVGIKQKSYPIRADRSRHNSVLFAELATEKRDYDYICSIRQGFSINLGLPGQERTVLRRSFSAPHEFSTISIKPNVIVTSEVLRAYTPKQRGCFYNSERHLYFFKMYTQLNCKEECRANFTKHQCGCVKYSMPRKNSTNICGGGKIACYKMAVKKLFTDDVIGDNFATNYRDECNCLPSCTSITYDFTIDKESFNLNQILKDRNQSLDDSSKLPSAIYILFDEDNISVLQRIPLYTLNDFLAICGGLLGLFLGFSVLSIIEIIYFFSLRLVCAIRSQRAEVAALNVRRAPINSVSINITES